MKDIDVLIEALPYIKKFHDKKILIKYGGHAMVDEEAKSSTARDTVLLKYVGMKPLIVHGGGPEISKSMDKLGKESKFIKGLRVTDEETMEIIEMVLVGKISTEIVSELIKHDGKAISLSGKDSSLIFAHKKGARRTCRPPCSSGWTPSHGRRRSCPTRSAPARSSRSGPRRSSSVC